MSQTLDAPSHQITEADMPRGHRGRGLIVAVLIVSFIASTVLRGVAQEQRRIATVGNNPIKNSGSKVGSMNSFTLALLLGGLRGPLVMMLWTSSETQKQEKDLEDFDTKVELIRLLQPEFDSVLLFQIWNKAYNISVQMSSLHNKYMTILDAIDYGQSALRDRPDNINVISAVADVYFNKLGNSAEKSYYRTQVRKESLPHKAKINENRNDPTWRRTKLDALLDDKGNLLPELTAPTRQRPASLGPDKQFNDGSDLQYLKKFEPFPYGVSPVAIGYNYYMQAQTLQRVTHARHAQTSEMVVDSRPAIALKFWTEEEQELGRRNEMEAFNIQMPPGAGTERLAFELPAADLKLDLIPANKAKLTEAIYNYGRAAQLVDAAVDEYNGHLKNFPSSLEMYRAHIDGLKAVKHFSLADAAYLRAMTAAGDERKKLLETASREYEETLLRYIRITLKYYTDEGMFRQAAPGVSREQVDALPPQQLIVITSRINAMLAQGAPESHMDDRQEYGAYITRCQERLKNLEQAK